MIDQRLLAAIADKKGISVKAVYPLINKVMRETFLERDLAALVVATKLHIGITRYSTPAQREQIRAQTAGLFSTSHVTPPLPPSGNSGGQSVRTKSRAATKSTRLKDNSVFVIHGRDLKLRDSIYAFLSALGCKPVEFHQAVTKVRGAGTPFIGQVLDAVFEQAQALVVLLSPDDDVQLKPQFVGANERKTEGRRQSQPRANVIFEAGMALARHEEKTIMVQVGSPKAFSDVAGRHTVHLNDTFESRNAFASRLEKLCKIDRTGSTWTTIGNFVPASSSVAKKKTR